MKNMTISQFRVMLSEAVNAAEAGEPITLTRNGKIVAALIPFSDEFPSENEEVGALVASPPPTEAAPDSSPLLNMLQGPVPPSLDGDTFSTKEEWLDHHLPIIEGRAAQDCPAEIGSARYWVSVKGHLMRFWRYRPRSGQTASQRTRTALHDLMEEGRRSKGNGEIESGDRGRRASPAPRGDRRTLPLLRDGH